MPYLLRLPRHANPSSKVIDAIQKHLPSGEREEAKRLAERGGVLRRGLSKAEAERIRVELAEAGVEARIEEEQHGDGGSDGGGPVPEGSTYRLLGRVVDRETGLPLGGLVVQAWDDDVKLDDFLGTDTTDAGGAFDIAFGASRFADAPTDPAPDLFFRIRWQDRTVAELRDPDWKNLAPGKTLVELGVERPQGAELPPFRVRGTVRLPDQKPAAGYTVRVEDADLRGSQRLGTASTDAEGRYDIAYTLPGDDPSEKGRADLHFRVFTRTGREVAIDVDGREAAEVGGRTILFNAGPVEEVDLAFVQADDDLPTRYDASEYELAVERLLPLAKGLTLEALTPDDVRFLHHDARLGVGLVALVASDARFAAQTGLPRGTGFGWAQQEMGVIEGEGGLPALDLDALLEHPVGALMDALESSLKDGVVPAALADRREAIRQRLNALGRGARTAGTADGLLDLRRAAGLTVAELDDEGGAAATLVRDRAAASIRAQLDVAFAAAPRAVQDAVRGVDLRSLDPSADLRAVLTEALAASEDVPAESAAAAIARLPLDELPRTFGEVLQPERPLAEHPLLQDDLRRAQMLRVGELAGVGSERLLETVLAPDGPRTFSNAALGGLVEDGVVGDDEARALGFASDLSGLLQDDALADALLEAEFAALDDGRARSTRDLARLAAADLAPIIAEVQGGDGAAADPEALARTLAGRFEYLHPDEAVFSRVLPGDGIDDLEAAIAAAGDALDAEGNPFHPGGAPADLDGDALAGFERVRELANTFAGLGVQDVLLDPTRSAAEKAEVVQGRVQLFERFRADNADRDLLALDLTAGSDAADGLEWGQIGPDDRAAVTEALKAFQLTYAVSGSAPIAQQLMSTGYASALQIASTSSAQFHATSGLSLAEAQRVYQQAQGTVGYVTSVAGSVIDVLKGGFDDLFVGNLGPSIRDFLGEIDGYEELFGSLDFCSCEHCQSILGPAAYFVDLMLFVEQHVLDEHFDGGDADDVLNLKVRRPDLWTLPLTCEHTNALVPTLLIVDEVLENYIARAHGFDGGLSVGAGVDRSAVERFVYRDHLAAGASSFRQPFLLPLRELEVYLQHFERTRADVADALGSPEPVATRARLSVSAAEYGLITGPNDGEAFLERVYDLAFDVAGAAVEPVDAQELLGPMGLSRSELGELLAATFVRGGGAALTVRSEKRDAASVQNDIERVYGLTRGALDRMHRFVRLLRRVPWTIPELDLVVTTLDREGLGAGLDADALRHVAALVDVQERLGASVEETVALWTRIPRTPVQEDRAPLFDRLFNAEGFDNAGGAYPRPGVDFVHPAWQAGADTADLNRLLAGLRVSDEALYALIVHLAGPLGVDVASADPADQGVALSEAHLALIYRHARLAEHLDLDVAELFQLLSFLDTIPNDHVASFDDLLALLAGYDRWQAAPYDLDPLGAITGGQVLGEDDALDPADTAAAIVEAVAADGALTFADTALAYLDGVSEADARAILAANPAAVVEDADSGLLRLADDFDPAAAVVIPAGIGADPAAVRDALVAYHASEVLPAYLGTQLGIGQEKTRALLALQGADLAAADLAEALRGGGVDPLVDLVGALYPLHLLFSPSGLTAADVDFAAANAGLFAIADVAALTPETAWRVAAYHRLLTDRPGPSAADEHADAYRADLQAVLLAHDPAAGFDAADPAVLARLFDVEEGLLATLGGLDLSGAAVHALERLEAAVALARHLGVGGAVLEQVVAEDYDALALARDAIRGAIRAKYADEATWESVIEPFRDAILEVRRDALVDHLVRAGHAEFDEADDLYRHLLLDVHTGSCARTSRVVEATASLQLYVHRCLMNLEQDRRAAGEPGRTHVLPQSIPAEEWAWRKNYRVWEANRKVFLYPETYIEPELRDNKTPLFEALEGSLLQQPVTEQAVLDAYAEYVRGFEEVARLQVAGAFHDEGADTDVLHLFGVTPTTPPTYYHREIENLITSEQDPTRGVVYGPWRKVEVQIPVPRAAPVVFRGTLYLFWVEIATRPRTDFVDGESRFWGYYHTHAFKYTARRLDGTWTAPQPLDLRAHTAYPFHKGVGLVLDSVGGPHRRAYYDNSLAEHDGPRDGYTLTGSRFDRLYPDVHEWRDELHLTGMTYKLHASVDFHRNAISDRDGGFEDGASHWTGSIERGKLVTTRFHDDHWDLYLGTPAQHLFDDYAFASAVADSRRMDEAALNWTGSLESDIREDLYEAYLAKLPEPTEVTVVNGAVSDALIDLSGDLLYVQGSARDGERALVRRMGTTLSEDIGRTLVTSGVAGLLQLDAQRAFQELDSPLYERGGRLDDAVNAGELDFTGPYGTYYRELFFHVPFLIADHLNSQGHYAEAQKWYHYLFDPTAAVEEPAAGEDEDDARRDRPWRYLEFRGLDAARLRDLLTDPAAVETYEKDPFNPHAIARLRLSAYQKAVVMKYIDNLLDWADALFTRDTRESITEALLLYITASDILGDRPAELGSCGEGALDPKTYERIRPLIDEDSPFLIELERFVRSTVPLATSSVAQPGPYTLGSAAIRDAKRAADRKFGLIADAAERIGLGGGLALAHSVAGGDGVAFGAEPVVHAAPPAVEVGDGVRAVAAGPVYRTGWGRTQTATWQSPGTPVARPPAGGGSAAAAGPSMAAAATAPGLQLGRDVVLAGTTAVGTHFRPDVLDDKRLPSFGISLIRQVSPVFCVPPNADLRAYWDRVEDRLYKIRHCMNISGVRRQLALFAPPIDPRLLVRAQAAGLSLEDALGLTAGELPPYRFAALIGRAKAYAATVQGFGGALLGALEKKDAEDLARLRLVHQENLARLTTTVREQQIEVAAKALEGLHQRRAAAEYRKGYYEGLLSSGISAWEATQVGARIAAGVFKGVGSVLEAASGTAHVVPEAGAPTAMKYGGKQVGDSLGKWATAMNVLGTVSDTLSASAGLAAGFERRAQGWEHQAELAEHELDALDVQIEGATVQWEIAVEQLAVHQRQIEQAEELFDFYGEKFTGLGLYTLLSSTLQRLFREAYNGALAMARLAEQAFRFERPDHLEVALSASHWDAGRAGLLAGEELLLELQTMERRFLETDDRQLEIDQAFSLQQIDPAALVALKETGRCSFGLPERYFDLFYPGQYRRTIKSVRLTVPCVAGPFANVGATLTLLSSEIRRDPDPAVDPAPAPSSRTTTVATSTAQNDAGVFELSFRGERYLPFEGAGAVNSTWELALPTAFRPFDYHSINDVIVRISYTARFDGAFRDHVETENAALEGTLAHALAEDGLVRAFGFRSELSTPFHRLLQAGLNEPVPFELTEQHFPIFLRGRALDVTRALLAVRPAEGVAVGALQLALDGDVFGGFAALPELGGLPGVDVSGTLAGDPRGGHELEVRATGDLGLGAGQGLDPERVADLVLVLEYTLDA